MKKIVTILLMCIMFYACRKDSVNSPQFTFPKVSYTLHTKFGNQVYDYSHFSFADKPDIYGVSMKHWDSSTVPRFYYPCQVDGGNRMWFDLYDSILVGFSMFAPVNLAFTLPSIKSFTNRYDSNVVMVFADTIYIGQANVSLDITSVGYNKYAEPVSTMNGTFNLSGTVTGGFIIDDTIPFHIDSIPFSSSGTFTNMAYFEAPH